MSSLQRSTRAFTKICHTMKRHLSASSSLLNQHKHKINKEAIYEENWKLRCELATAYRAFERLGMNEGVCNHLTAKAPSLYTDNEMILLIPYGMYWSDVTPEDLIGVDMNSPTVIEGKGTAEKTATAIHKGIYRNRPDVNAIMHTHPRYATVLSVLEDPEIKMIHQNSARFRNNVAYDKGYDGLSNEECNDEGDRIGKATADKEVLLMGSHGLTTFGKTIAAAFDANYYFEKAAEVQILAYQTGKPLLYLSEEVAEKTEKELSEFYDEGLFQEHHLYALMNMFKRKDPGFIKKFSYKKL